MCDFRKITKIVLDSGAEINIPDTRIVVNSYHYEEVETEPGLYLIPCSGSFHLYFDGNTWLREGNGWSVKDYTDQCSEEECQLITI